MNIKDLTTRQKIGWVLTIVFALFITFMSATNKLTGNPETVEQFANHGLDGWLLVIGIGEVSSLILFLFPQTMRLGLVLFSSYFGGAIMFHMSRSEDFTMPAAFLILVWIIASIRQRGAILRV